MPTGRPTVLHDGFLIPNASDVTNPRMAEPDRVDFNTLAHPLWGVIDNCEVTVAGSTASTQGGTVLVNGRIVTMGPKSVGLRAAGSDDRFDLVVSDASGILTVIEGTGSVDPVFPDVPLSNTVLAAVFCPAGSGSLADNVIDKRKFVSKALLTKIPKSDDLIRNMNGAGNHFLLDGGGRATWESDTWMWRSGEAQLTLHRHLHLEGTLTANGSAVVSGDVVATGNVYGANLRLSNTAPTAPLGSGTIWQDSTSGRVYVWRNGSWQELATIESANPPGTVITSFEKPSVMKPLGWVPLNGEEVTELQYPNLFQVQGLAHLIQAGTPRTMKLPNARKRVLVTDFDQLPGTDVSPNSGNRVTLKASNLPRHGHNPVTHPNGSASPRVTIGRSGQHIHKIYGDGKHDHSIEDLGHQHEGMDYGGAGAPVIALEWGGQNKIDALFNDRNHTFSVNAMLWTKSATTGIKVSTLGSGHYHTISEDGDHDHTATVDGIANHTHPMSEDKVGNDESFDITPEYLVVYSYVRS